MDTYQLNDGRKPLRFDKGNAAFYKKARGTGEVRYTFAMIRHFQKNRPLMSAAAKSALRKEQARKLKEKDPEFFHKLGQKRHAHERNQGHDVS